MQIKNALLVIAVAIAFGCSKSSDSKPATLAVDPALRQKVTSATPMSPELHDRATKALRPGSLKLPDLSLILEKGSQETQQEKLSKLDDEGRAILEKIKTSCRIDRGSDEESRSGEGVGSRYVTTRKDSVAGETCPVSMTETNTITMIVKSLDSKTKTGSFDFEVKTESDSTVYDKELQASSGQRRQTTSTKINASVKNADQSGIGSAQVTYTGSGGGSIELADGTKLPITLEASGFKTPSASESAIVVTIKFPEGDLQIAVFGKDGKGEFFVNGRPATKEEIEADYGTELDEEMGNLK